MTAIIRSYDRTININVDIDIPAYVSESELNIECYKVCYIECTTCSTMCMLCCVLRVSSINIRLKCISISFGSGTM